MSSISGVSFPEGMFIGINPTQAIVSGKFVVAKHQPTNSILFRRYIEDGGNRYLRPLNPNWPEQFTKMDGTYIIVGVVQKAYWHDL